MALVIPDHLDPARWRGIPRLADLLAALGGEAGETRFVGGFVRDGLRGVVGKDIDLATRLSPETVMARVAAAGLKAVPTGLAHGTVTVPLPEGPVEVTTLRRDVSTDGRHAVVDFTDDWREDAARRDFTINALFAATDGGITDYFGGLADLAAGRIRFIGDPLLRIAEDHLRILRFFRFHARFAAGPPDEAAIAACRARANDLMALSRERIADEMLKLLALADPTPTVALMLANGILTPVLPEITEAARLAALVAREQALGVAPDPLRRLAALLPAEPATAEAVAARLKLSNAARKRLRLAAEDASGPVLATAYMLGTDAARDRALLYAGDAGAALAALDGWERPTLPVSGGALIAAGVPKGPLVATALQKIERRWIAEGFPDRDRVAAITAEEVAQASRSSR
jgi:poly(A) polymerase